MPDVDRPLTPEEEFLLADANSAFQALINNSTARLTILSGAILILSVLIPLVFGKEKDPTFPELFMIHVIIWTLVIITVFMICAYTATMYAFFAHGARIQKVLKAEGSFSAIWAGYVQQRWGRWSDSTTHACIIACTAIVVVSMAYISISGYWYPTSGFPCFLRDPYLLTLIHVLYFAIPIGTGLILTIVMWCWYLPSQLICRYYPFWMEWPSDQIRESVFREKVKTREKECGQQKSPRCWVCDLWNKITGVD